MISRRDKRKAARQEKKHLKHQALLHHKISHKQKGKDTSRTGSVRKDVKDKAVSLTESGSDRDKEPQEGIRINGGYAQNFRNNDVKNNAVDGDFSLTESDSEGDDLFAYEAPCRESWKDNQDGKKTKFEEYLELEMKAGASMEEDLEMERRLAKKLKVKNGKLKDDDDGLNSLFEDLPSILDMSEHVCGEDSHGETIVKKSKKKGKKKLKMSEPASDSDDAECKENSMQSLLLDSDEEAEAHAVLDCETEKVVGGENKNSKKKRKRKNSDLGNSSENDTSDMGQAENMALESGGHVEAKTRSGKDDAAPLNVAEGGGKYVAPHMRSRSGDDLQEYIHIRRRIRGLLNRVSESNVESITVEIFSIFQSVTRAAGTQIISEEVLASCSGGPRGNEQYASVFAAFVAGTASMVGIDFGAKFLASFATCFEDEYLKEDNLSLRNLSLLLSYLCIFRVCSSDLVYDFLIKLSKRLTEVDASTILTVLQCCGMKLRGDDPAAMKDFIISVQGRVNELKAGSLDVEATEYGKRMEFMLKTICDIKNNKRRSKEDTPQHTRVNKWLQKLRVEDITIRGMKWKKLLDPEKKGQWWFSTDLSSATEDIGKVAIKIDRDVHEAQKILNLAAKLRMNTDIRKAIFCVIMSAEDYIDAFERLLSLNLQGKQDREIMRVLLECCLQEKVFNKYYTVLASKLCSHDKNHKFSLQYCIWDQFKELDAMPLLRSMHLAKFVAEMLAGFHLSLAVLKVVDLIDTTQLTAKRAMHFRMLFEAIFEQPDSVVWNMFTRVAVTPELEELRNGMEFFIREYVVTANKDVGKRFKLAKKALSNIQGVLM